MGHRVWCCLVWGLSLGVGHLHAMGALNHNLCLSLLVLNIISLVCKLQLTFLVHEKKNTNAENVSLLYNHVSAPTEINSRYYQGCNIKFNVSWLQKYPWLRYSQKLNASFCGSCSLFWKTDITKACFNRPFSNWVKINSTMKYHSGLACHHICLQVANVTKSAVENPATRTDVISNTALQLRNETNKHIIQKIIRSVIFLVKQGLPLCGDKEKITSKVNPGNFLALLKSFAETDSILHSHLYTPTSPGAIAGSGAGPL